MARNGKTKAPIDTALLERVQVMMARCHIASVKKWAEELGLSQATLNKKVRGDEAFSYGQLMKILQHHPDVSADWLLLGRGEIFGVTHSNESLLEENGNLKEQIAKQCSQILLLNDELEKKNKQIDVLLDEKVKDYEKK